MSEIDLKCQPALPPDASTDVAVEDLGLLFSAVNARLRLLAQPGPGPDSADAAHLRTDVSECARAQEQLAATAMHELGRHH